LRFLQLAQATKALRRFINSCEAASIGDEVDMKNEVFAWIWMEVEASRWQIYITLRFVSLLSGDHQ
jgi:hypothetical protein